MLSVEGLAAELRAKAAGMGVGAIGFAAASPMEPTRRAIEERKAAGFDAGMQFTYRAPRRSTDPSTALPGAVSLIVCAWPYGPARPSGDGPFAPDHHEAGRTAALPVGPGPPMATVARYARKDHYADLRATLSALVGVLRAHGWRGRVLVDDNALVDRAAAHRAGLGWFGKNCNILLPEKGSWFVLGSVVTDAPLPYDDPVPDGCGNCRRCHVACPTGALVGPGVLDARKCLAWLLQAPGPFPFGYREALGDRIYGCDDCQSSCPVNLRAARNAPSRENADVSRLAGGVKSPGGPGVDVLELLSMTDAELLERYGRWYIPTRDPRYVRRNALVVMGNVADPLGAGVEAALLSYLRHPDQLLRAHAIWAALRLGRGDLVDATQTEGARMAPEVRQELERREEVVPRPLAGESVCASRL